MRAQGFLAKTGARIERTIDAKKAPLGSADAVKLAREASHIWATKGKQVLHFDMKKAPPTDEELIAAIVGPFGNLRAPSFRRGKRLFVGMNEEEFGKLLG